jgi:hypothetical protein
MRSASVSSSGGGYAAYGGGNGPVIALPASVAETVGGRQRPQSGGQAPETNPLIDFDIEAVKIGDPIPVVFCRRVNSIGGVMVRPRATFAAIQNDSTTITTKWHCIISDGQVGPIPVKNVRRGGCRSDFQFSQNYDKRAGTWEAGNFALPQQAYEIPAFPTATGLGGHYTKLTTIEFRHTLPYFYNWKAGYNVFVEEGIYVNRILDGVFGSSNNIVDLILWARDQTKKIPGFLNDIPSLKHAAKFVDQAGLLCNGEFKNSGSLVESMTSILPHFLLRPTKVNGKFSLRPLIPTNDDGTINTGTIYPDHCFTEDVIIPGSYRETTAEVSTIIPPILSMIWRQQDTSNDFPLIRSSLVADQSIVMEDVENPPEQIDISVFCTSELHMARVGAYIYAKRTLCRRTASVQLAPGSHTGKIREGDVVQIKHVVRHSDSEEFYLNRWWEVVTISENESLSLIEFPVDQCGKSLLARAVANAPVSGVVLLPPQPASCDLPGRATDESVPAPSSIILPPASMSKPDAPTPPLGGGVDVPLPIGPSPEPPPSTPTPPATPGGPPSDLLQPPIPPQDWPCEDGYGEIIVNIHSAAFVGGNQSGWAPRVDTVRTIGGVAIKYDPGISGQIINWWYRAEYINAQTGQKESVFLTASEDGTGGANAANGDVRVWAVAENADCTTTTIVDKLGYS